MELFSLTKLYASHSSFTRQKLPLCITVLSLYTNTKIVMLLKIISIIIQKYEEGIL